MFAPCRSNCLFVIRAKKVTLSGRVTNAMAPANRRSVCTKGQKVTLPGPTPPKLDPVMGTRLRPRQSAAEAAGGNGTGRNGPQATPSPQYRGSPLTTLLFFVSARTNKRRHHHHHHQSPKRQPTTYGAVELGGRVTTEQGRGLRGGGMCVPITVHFKTH